MSEVAALLDMISKELIQKLKRPVRIAVSGAQGSGKTTGVKAFAKADPKVAHFSLDDLYLATAERKALAATVSPMFKVRGAPGSHDLELGKRVLRQLEVARSRDRTPLPRFDKLKDTRAPAETWPSFEGTANVVVVEGWCMGALPQTPEALAEPVNALEAKEDANGAWRGYANAQLEGPYQAFFDRFDVFVFLATPDIEIVPQWRMEQEAELRGTSVDKLDPQIRANVERFVQHYERLTANMLRPFGRRPSWTVRLDEARNVLDIEEPHYPSVKKD